MRSRILTHSTTSIKRCTSVRTYSVHPYKRHRPNRTFSTVLHYDSCTVPEPVLQSKHQPTQHSNNQTSVTQSTQESTINPSPNQQVFNTINSQAIRQFPECPPHLNPANLPLEPSIIAPISFYRARYAHLNAENQQSSQTPNHTNQQSVSQAIDQSFPINELRPVQRVLIYKKVTTLEEIRRGAKNPVDYPYLRADAKVLLADREHSHTLRCVRNSLSLLGFEWREVETLTNEDLSWCDAVCCVGGDGTFLKAQRALSESVLKPMLGVNSAPSSSFGFFCAADHASVGALLERVRQGSALLAPLWRMRVCVNGQPVGPLILNEMLFCNPIPSGTTRYWLTDGRVSQQQQSSGIWISTAAGSTGAIHGAGGELMNLSDCRFQYRIRELFSLPLTHPRELPVDAEFPHLSFRSRPSLSSQVLTAGYCEADFSLQSRMMSGCLYFDGSQTAYPVLFNDTITLQRSAYPLLWVAPTLKNDGRTVADHWELVTGLQRAKLPPKQAQAQREQASKYGFEQYNQNV